MLPRVVPRSLRRPPDLPQLRLDLRSGRRTDELFLIKRGMDTHQPTLVLGGMVLIAAAAYGTSLLVTLFEGKLCPWKRTIENL